MGKAIETKMETPFLSIILANYNGENYLRTCLNSLSESSLKNYEVLFIDNNSTDSSIEIISEFKKTDPRIKILRNKVNIGVPASRNIAISHCQGEIIILLDNDTELKRDSLEQLIKPLIEDESIGAAQALLLDFENRNLIQLAGGHLIPQTIWLWGFHERSEYKKIKPKLKRSNIIAISAVIAVKKKVMDIVKGYDEKMYHYSDDLDFAWRVWIAGFRVVLSEKSIVYHYTKGLDKRANIGSNKFDVYFHMAKNSFRSILKNYEPLNAIKYLIVSLFVNIARALLVLIRRGDLSALLATMKSILWLVTNLPDTIKKREMIQKTRKFSDKKIMDKVFVREGLIQIYNNFYRSRSSKLLW